MFGTFPFWDKVIHSHLVLYSYMFPLTYGKIGGKLEYRPAQPSLFLDLLRSISSQFLSGIPKLKQNFQLSSFTSPCEILHNLRITTFQ